MIRFDCHAHVYKTVTAVPGARYVPEQPAHLREWLGHQAAHGLAGGVIVQVSFLGTDNSQLCRALAALDRERFAGVAVVPLDVDAAALDGLVAAGVRGVRWNMVRGGVVPDLRAPVTRAFVDRLRTRGMHLEVHLEGPRLAPLLPALTDLGLPLVVDHFGLPSEADPACDPLVRAVQALDDPGALYMKFSAHYRLPFDVTPHAEKLLERVSPSHIVWGSDWPHTQNEDRTGYADTYARIADWGALDDGIATSILYGIGHGKGR
ncbi:amidohydrolase family protein [Tropicibacter sp. S64]|uniref:amidohydrolase family protein n=1 Tax=Tropicibacter sp. S64 TaxID=3415122 RepID=UPI003C7C8AA0